MLPDSLVLGGAAEQEGLSAAPGCPVWPPAPARADKDKHALRPESPQTLRRARATARDESRTAALAPRRPLLPHQPPHKEPARLGGPNGLGPGREGRERRGLQLTGNFPAETPPHRPRPLAALSRSHPLTWRQQPLPSAARNAGNTEHGERPQAAATCPSPAGGARHQPLLLPPAPAARRCVGPP